LMFSIVGFLGKLFQTAFASIFRHSILLLNILFFNSNLTKRVKNTKYILLKVSALNFQRCKKILLIVIGFNLFNVIDLLNA
jgi:hypothetical protein